MIGLDVLPQLTSARYRLVRELGRGGMGVVYEAVDRETGAHVALKLLPRAHPEALLAFKREFRTLTTVTHPHLVTPYELIADGEQWYFTMALVPGSDLLTWVRRGRDPATTAATFDERVDEARLRSALRQIAEGVGALHRAGLLHRDLKPSNVLVRDDGHVAILDFGLTVELRERVTTTETTAGTLAYMSPEQLASESLGSASDWYALGVMLYEAMTGQLPFGTNVRQMLFAKLAGAYPPIDDVVAGAPEDLRRLCDALLHHDPVERATDLEILACLGGANETTGPLVDVSPMLAWADAAPLVGRERELAALDDALTAVRNGALRVVALHGRSGSGKSAIVQQFLQDKRAQTDLLVLAGRCYEQESVPFKAIDSLIDALTRRLLRVDHEAVTALLPNDMHAAARIFPVLRRIAAIDEIAGNAPHIPDPREVRRRAFDALRALLVALGHETSLVIAIDDLQWGDVDSAELLLHLLRTTGQPPLRALLLLSYRSEYRGTSDCLQYLFDPLTDRSRSMPTATGVLDISVAPLAPDAATALATALLGADAAAALAQRIATESGGNPFFIGELARHALEQSEWTSAPDGAVDLDGVLARRIARLPDAVRELLEVIAIAGQPVSNRHWRDAVDARTRGPDVLAQLRRERLIRSTGVSADDEVEAYHDRIRETVIARLDPTVRASWHRRLGTALEQHGDADAETVAVHFVQGGLPERAWPHFRQAADAAARALAFERAAALYEQALAHHVGPSVDRAPLLLSLGEVRANSGRGRPAADAFEAAATLATTEADRLDRMRMAAAQLCVSGAVDLGRERFREVLRGVGLRPAQSAVGILAQLAFRRTRLRVRGLSFTPRTEQAVPATLLRRLDTLWAASRGLSSVDVVGVAALQSQALLFALEAGEPRRLALALAWEAVMVATSGVTAAPRADELLRLARSLADRTDDEATHAMMQLSTGWVAFLQGRFIEALQICGEAEAAFRDRCVGVWWELLLSRTLLAWAAAHMGRLSELSAMIRQWEPQARARGDHFLVTNLLSYAMPHECMLLDDVAGARAHVREALALWPYEGFHLQHVSVLFSEGLLALYQGDGATACAAISARWRVMVSTLQTQNQQTRVMLRDVRARGALQAAAVGIDRARHLAQVERDARALVREDAPWARAFGQRLQGGVSLLRGDVEHAVSQFERALPALDASGLALHAAVIRRRVGELRGGDDGRQLAAQSEALLRTRGVVNLEATARAFGVG